MKCVLWGQNEANLDAHVFVVAQEPDELFETVTQCLMSGADRDALSGWGAIVYVMCEHLPYPCTRKLQHQSIVLGLRDKHACT